MRGLAIAYLVTHRWLQLVNCARPGHYSITVMLTCAGSDSVLLAVSPLHLLQRTSFVDTNFTFLFGSDWYQKKVLLGKFAEGVVQRGSSDIIFNFLKEINVYKFFFFRRNIYCFQL